MRIYKNYSAPNKSEYNEVRSTVGLRAKDLNAYHVVSEFLDALRREDTKQALAISHANEDLKPYFNYALQQYAAHGKNATLA